MAKTKKEKIRALIVKHGTALPKKSEQMTDRDYRFMVLGWRNAFAEVLSAIDFEI